MKHIIINNLGPLRHAEVDLEKFNVVIGPQSSGKSCLLKTASYCTWVEKRIQLSQKPEIYMAKEDFVSRFVSFHKLKGYLHPDTFISYESDFMKFSYDKRKDLTEFEWKSQRWDYVAPKISYIPAERNMVAAIPNWFDVRMADDNIRSFMSDWQSARTSVIGDLAILNLNVAYHYDALTNSDKVIVKDGPTLDFTNTSSGLQSLIPMAVQLDYLTNTRFKNTEMSVAREVENRTLLGLIYKTLFIETGKTEATQLGTKNTNGRISVSASVTVSNIGNSLWSFKNNEAAEECRNIYSNFTEAKCNNIIIEEPEQNLFPPTQEVLIMDLINKTKQSAENTLMLSTHSSYVVTSMLERRDLESFALFVAKSNLDGSYDIATASADDIQMLYDQTIDAFYNLSIIGE
ncbi:MAG: ATP-binding protein [Bacteroidales bacterium]|nr:ATP-binding protein [Bacteroidales bacterium]